MKLTRECAGWYEHCMLRIKDRLEAAKQLKETAAAAMLTTAIDLPVRRPRLGSVIVVVVTLAATAMRAGWPARVNEAKKHRRSSLNAQQIVTTAPDQQVANA